MKLTIIIVTWNSRHYLYDCLHSLANQTLQNFSIIIVDNASNDGSPEFLRKNFQKISLLQNFKNTGFSYANNQGIKLAKTPFVLVMNPDIILEKYFIENIMRCANEHPRGGSFCGKMFQLSQKNIDTDIHGDGLIQPIQSKIIDSAGIIAKKNRTFANRGENEEDSEKYNRTEQVFGASGCCALYRKEALEDIKTGNEYFDEDFFAYKEDIDLAWRLRLLGWESWYVPTACAHHFRSFAKSRLHSMKKIRESRKKVSKKIRMLSFKNHYLTLLKNETLQNFFISFFPIFFHGFARMAYSLIFEPYVFSGIPKIIFSLPKILKKRTIIQNKKILSSREIQNYFQ